jgi:hypothetical protein
VALVIQFISDLHEAVGLATPDSEHGLAHASQKNLVEEP